MREIESNHLLALLEQSLARAEELGLVVPGDRQLRVHMLFGAMTEAAVFVARARRPRQALQHAVTEINRLLDGIQGARR